MTDRNVPDRRGPSPEWTPAATSYAVLYSYTVLYLAVASTTNDGVVSIAALVVGTVAIAAVTAVVMAVNLRPSGPLPLRR